MQKYLFNKRNIKVEQVSLMHCRTSFKGIVSELSKTDEPLIEKLLPINLTNCELVLHFNSLISISVYTLGSVI